MCNKSTTTYRTYYAEVSHKLNFDLSKYKSPAAKYAKLFVQVADENDLDWRLLPMFAFIESTGGKKHNNNIFGWDSGRAKFKTVEEGIRHVGGRALTLGPYKGKTPAQKIRVYNIHTRYYKLANKVMEWLNSVEL